MIFTVYFVTKTIIFQKNKEKIVKLFHLTLDLRGITNFPASI